MLRQEQYTQITGQGLEANIAKALSALALFVMGNHHSHPAHSLDYPCCGYSLLSTFQSNLISSGQITMPILHTIILVFCDAAHDPC